MKSAVNNGHDICAVQKAHNAERMGLPPKKAEMDFCPCCLLADAAALLRFAPGAAKALDAPEGRPEPPWGRADMPPATFRLGALPC